MKQLAVKKCIPPWKLKHTQPGDPGYYVSTFSQVEQEDSRKLPMLAELSTWRKA